MLYVPGRNINVSQQRRSYRWEELTCAPARTTRRTRPPRPAALTIHGHAAPTRTSPRRRRSRRFTRSRRRRRRSQRGTRGSTAGHRGSRARAAPVQQLADSRNAGVEAGGDGGGDGDGDADAEAGGQVGGHLGRAGGAGGGARVRARGVVGAAGAAVQAGAGAVRALAAVVAGLVGVGPEVDVGQRDAGAGGGVGAEDLDGGAFRVYDGAGEVGEFEVGEDDAVSGVESPVGPVLVDVEGVGVRVADEIAERAVTHVPVASVRLNHDHLVGLPGVDVVVLNVGNGGAAAERAKC